MSLRCFFGFDHENSMQQLIDKWPGISGQWDYTPNTPFGDGRALLFNNPTNAKIHFPFDSQPTWIVGYHFFPYGGLTEQRYLIRLYDDVQEQVRLEYSTAGHLEVRDGNGVLLAVTTEFYNDPTWKHIQFKTTIDNTAGAYEVQVNDKIVLSGSGVDTQISPNPSADGIQLGLFGYGYSYIDNLWVCDGAGVTFNDCLGELRVITRRPNAPGNYTEWTPNTGTNWAAVDDPQPDEDATYVSSLTPGNKDSFPLVTLGVDSGVIHAVNRNIRARKDDVDQREIAMLTRQDAMDYEGANLELFTPYKSFRQQMETCPDTTEWTREKFAAMQWGYTEKV